MVAALLAGTFAGCTFSAAGATNPARLSAIPGNELLTEPGQVAPIYAAIDSARRSVDVTMYDLADPMAEHALVAAASRGVQVRVLLNDSYENLTALRYLPAHGVQVRLSPWYFTLTHQKTITIDHRRSLVMTLNLTARYYAMTRDFAIWDRRPADVEAIESVFDADWVGRPIVPPTGTGDLLWSPGAEGALVGLIEGARASIDVENEEMADPPIIAALCAAAHRRVRVRVVMTYASEWANTFAALARCGVRVHVYHGERPLYIHAKEILADGTTAYLGSQNFSYDSLEQDRELGLITTNHAVIRSLEATFDGDYRGARPVGE